MTQMSEKMGKIRPAITIESGIGERPAKRRAAAVLLILSMSLLIVSGCASTGHRTSGRQDRNDYSISDDIAMGETCLRHNINAMNRDGVGVNEDISMMANLEEIVMRLASVSELPDLPFTVTLFQTDAIVNASAAPGGAIMIYSGLYNGEAPFVVNNQELAAVIAHEVAHVTCRHATEKLTRKKAAASFGRALTTLASVALSVGTGNAAIGNLGRTAVGLAVAAGHGLWFPSYSRQQEYEADAVGLMTMAKARIDPRAAVAIWKRASEKTDGDTSGILSSHPRDASRLKHLEACLPEALALFESAGGSADGRIVQSPFGEAPVPGS